MKLATKLTSGIIAAATVLGLIAARKFVAAFANAKRRHTLSGKIINDQGQAVADARIIIFNEADMAQATESKTATTDKNNRFKIEGISSGTYTVKVESDNYETSKRLVRLNRNKNLTIALKSSFQ